MKLKRYVIAAAIISGGVNALPGSSWTAPGCTGQTWLDLRGDITSPDGTFHASVDGSTLTFTSRLAVCQVTVHTAAGSTTFDIQPPGTSGTVVGLGPIQSWDMIKSLETISTTLAATTTTTSTSTTAASTTIPADTTTATISIIDTTSTTRPTDLPRGCVIGCTTLPGTTTPTPTGCERWGPGVRDYICPPRASLPATGQPRYLGSLNLIAGSAVLAGLVLIAIARRRG